MSLDNNNENLRNRGFSKANANDNSQEELSPTVNVLTPPTLQFFPAEKEEELTESKEEQSKLDVSIDPPEARLETPDHSLQFKVDIPSSIDPPPLQFKTKVDVKEEPEDKSAQFNGTYSYAPPSSGDDNSEDGDNNKNNADTTQLKDNPNPSNSGTTSSSTGPLPSELQSNIEQNLGTDLSSIKIHENSSKASDVGALAYTQGNDVHFAPGQFNPSTSSGQELIGHELTHVKQQREGRVKPTTEVNGMPVNDNPGLENEADVLGKQAVQRKVDPAREENKTQLKSSNENAADTAVQGKFEIAQLVEGDGVQQIPETSVIRSGSTILEPSDADYTVSGTYRQVKNLLHERSEAGSITTGITAQDYTGTEERANAILHVTIVKSMPVWTEFPEIESKAQDENQENRPYYQRIVQVWNRFLTSLDAHEEEHKRIDTEHFTNCHTRVIGKTIAEATAEYDLIEGEAFDLNETYHETVASAIYALPYIPEAGEGTVVFHPDEPAQTKADPLKPSINQEDIEAVQLKENKPAFQLKAKNPTVPFRLNSENNLIQKKEASSGSDHMPRRDILPPFSLPNSNPIQKKSQEAHIPAYVNVQENSSKATKLNAHAFTQGNDVHFAPGQFKPDTTAGKELIGHELKHVEQQAEGRVTLTVQRKGENINNDPGLEKEADDFGVKFANDQTTQLKTDNVGNRIQGSFQLKEENTNTPTILPYLEKSEEINEVQDVRATPFRATKSFPDSEKTTSNDSIQRTKKEGNLPVTPEQKSLTPFSLASENENQSTKNPLVQLKPAVQSADAPIMRKPSRQRPTLLPPQPVGPDMGDDPVADSTQAQQEQWFHLNSEINDLFNKLYYAQEANRHPTRDDWKSRASSMIYHMGTVGTTEEMDSILGDLDDLEIDMDAAARGPSDEWSALKDEAAHAGAEMLSLADIEGIYAYDYLMKKFKHTSDRVQRIDEQMLLREDFVDFAEVIGTREYQSQGKLRAARERFRELMQMLDTIGELRESGEDANKMIPGWEQLVDQEIDILIDFAGEATSIMHTQRFSILHGRLQNAKQKALSRKPKKMGFLDKGEALSKGIIGAVTDPFVEAAKQGVDLVKITAFTGYKLFGGDGWVPKLYSDMAEHVDQTGAGTWDILKQMPAGIIDTPERCFDAIKKGDWEAIGREGANLFMLYKAARQAPGKAKQIPGDLKRAAFKAVKVYRILKFRALSLRKGPGMSKAALKAVQKIAVEHGLEISFRPVSRTVIKLRRKGHPGKPEHLKMKTISELDVHLGANKADIGKVGFFKPKKPGNLKGLSSAKKLEVTKLYHKRRKEFGKLEGKVNKMVADGKIELRNGVVFEKGGKAYTGDHDAFSFTHDGKDISFEKLRAEVRNKLKADPIHTEHGAALSWEPKAGQAEYYAGNILKHRPGGERLVVIKPDGTIARKFFDK